VVARLAEERVDEVGSAKGARHERGDHLAARRLDPGVGADVREDVGVAELDDCANDRGREERGR